MFLKQKCKIRLDLHFVLQPAEPTEPNRQESPAITRDLSKDFPWVDVVGFNRVVQTENLPNL